MTYKELKIILILHVIAIMIFSVAEIIEGGNTPILFAALALGEGGFLILLVSTKEKRKSGDKK